MATRRSQLRVKDEDTPKRGRGRPPTSTSKSLQEEPTTNTGSSRKRKEPSTPHSVDAEDVVATSMSVRRKSGRERNVKSARELLGLISSDDIKKEKEEESHSSKKTGLKIVKSAVSKTPAVVKSAVSKTPTAVKSAVSKTPAAVKSSIVVVRTPQTQKPAKVRCLDKDIESSETTETQQSEVSSLKNLESKDNSSNEKDQSDSVPNPDEKESTNTITFEVPIEFKSSGDIGEDVKSHLDNYIIEKDSATGNPCIKIGDKVQCEMEQPTEKQPEETSETETFDGLVDPETGLIIAENVKNHSEIQIVQAENAEGGDGTVYVANEDGTTTSAVTVHSVANEAGEHQYFVFSSEDMAKETEGAKVLFEGDDMNLVVANPATEQQQTAQEIDTVCSMVLMDTSTEVSTPEASTSKVTVTVTGTSTPKSAFDMHSPSVLRDRRLLNKSNFSNTPVTSEELMSAPVGKNGRCVPQRQVVVAPELQDLVSQLKENDTMENHIVSVGLEEGLRNKYACKHCGEDIPNRHFFRRHMNVSHKDLDYKPWKCPLCDYKAIIKASIARHINVHSDMKPYTCLECGKGFTFRQKLQIHMKYHNDQRDHRCALCDMAFHELKTLKTHLSKIHGIEKPKEFIDKYRDKPLTSVLVQLDHAAKPTQGFLLPKEPEKKSSSKEFSHSEALKKSLFSRAQAAEKQQAQQQQQHAVEVIQQNQQIQEIIEQHQQQHQYDAVANGPSQQQQQQHEQQEHYEILDLDHHQQQQQHEQQQQQYQTVESSQQHHDQQQQPKEDETAGENVVEIQFAPEDDGTGSETVKNLLDLGWSEEGEQQTEPGQSTEISTEPNTTIVKMEEAEEMCGTEVQMVPEEVVEVSRDAVSDCDEVNVLLPRNKRSSTYGTRKTQLRTSRFRLGLEGNYTPIKIPMQNIPITEEAEEEREDDMDQGDDDTETKSRKGMINNQKVVLENQIEDELKKYCKVDTTSAVSRILFTCLLCPDEDQSEGSGDQKPANHFYSKTRFCTHLENAHPDIKPWVCVTCGYKSRMRSSLLAHSKCHQPIKKYGCHICDKKFLFKQKLNVHMRSHVNLRLHACTQCDKRFNETADLTRHIKRVHTTDRHYNCNKCNKSYHNEDSLVRHMDTHDPEKRFLCTYCNNYYRSKGSLSQHMKSHTCMFHCEICSKNFGSYSGFMAHKVMHDQSFEGFECEVCGKRLHTKGSFSRHKKVAHSNARPFSCTQCAKSFKTKKDLKNHGAVHSSVRAFSCPDCPFTCKRLESLKIHCRRHSDVKPYQCGLCGKQYTQRSSLDGHLRHHTGQAEATCKLCKREFGSKYLLRKHIQSSHMGPNPGVNSDQIVTALRMGGEEGVTVYMCEECNSVFLSQDDLAVHILAEHMKQGFSGDSATPIPSLADNEIPLDTGLPSSGLSEHSFDSQPPTIIDTETSEIGDQMQYITVDNPGGGGSKVVSLVHPSSSQTLALHPSATQTLELSEHPQLYVEDGKIKILKQENENPSMVTISDPSTIEDVVVPMATSALDALLVAGMEQQEQSVVVADYEQVAETVEVQQD